MELLHHFTKFVEKENLFHPKQRLLIAVSGGIDSMVLWHLCQSLHVTYAIAHCNFQLRGEESDMDEAFVRKQADSCGVDIFVQHFDTVSFSKNEKCGIQEAARTLRYAWFEELMKGDGKETTYDFLLTAHHADDNVETMLMNFFKGSGINGLKGILPKKGKVCRPMLFATKADLVKYASIHNVAYREDSSNTIEKYTRNYFRHSVIPVLNELLPGASRQLMQQAERFRDIKCIYDQYCTNTLKKLIEKKADGHYIPVLKLLKSVAYKTVLFELSNLYGFTAHQTGLIDKLLYADSGKYITSATHRILKNRKWLIITPLANEHSTFYLLEQGDEEVVTPQFNIMVHSGTYDGTILKDASIAQLDAATVSFPILLRKWKQGDYFYPLGMKKKKKISRFLIDQKLSLVQKEQTWVMECNKKIIWIVGMRIDERFKTSTATKKFIRFRLIAKN